MILSIKTSCEDPTDIGHLLHKNPANANVVSLSFGKAYVFYPVATESACEATLLKAIWPFQEGGWKKLTPG